MLNNIQTALQENIGYTSSKIIVRKHMLKLLESQTNLIKASLIKVSSSSAESNIYGRFVISQASDSDCSSDTDIAKETEGLQICCMEREIINKIYNYEKTEKGAYSN